MATTIIDAAGSDPIETLRSNGVGTDKLTISSVGQVQHADGSAATPSLSFLNDTDTGIYRAGSNQLSIATGGSLQWNFSGGLLQVSSGTGIQNADGTYSAPSYAFGSDTDTGLYRIAEDRLGISTNALTRLDIDTTRIAASLPLYEDDGSAGAPTYSFTNDTDLGIYRIGTDILGISTNGSERLRIDSSGNVGIGNSSPATLLDIGAATPKMRFSTTSGLYSGYFWEIRLDASDNFIYFKYGNNSSSSDVFHINTGGGIRTPYVLGPGGETDTDGGRLIDRGGSNQISFNWDGTNFDIYSGNTRVKRI